MSGLVVAVAFGRRQYGTRTRGGAHPFPSAQAAWDYRHAHGDGETPVPSAGKPKEEP